MIASALLKHHRSPTGVLLLVLIVLVVLYFAWRLGHVGKLRGAFRLARLRADTRGLRIRPMSFVPLLVLVIVVLVLLIAH